MRRVLVAAAGVGLMAGPAAAQGVAFKPIDTDKLIVRPTDSATNIFSGTARYVSRVVAGTVEGDGFVKTLNNLLGRKPKPGATTQPGLSPLPVPGLYPSTQYKNSFTPALPTVQTYGRSPGT